MEELKQQILELKIINAQLSREVEKKDSSILEKDFKIYELREIIRAKDADYKERRHIV